MLLAKHPKLFRFLPQCYPGHDMPCQTAQHHTLRLRNLQLMNHIPDYRRKSVPVVMTERRQLVTPSAKLHRLVGCGPVGRKVDGNVVALAGKAKSNTAAEAAASSSDKSNWS